MLWASIETGWLFPVFFSFFSLFTGHTFDNIDRGDNTWRTTSNGCMKVAAVLTHLPQPDRFISSSAGNSAAIGRSCQKKNPDK